MLESTLVAPCAIILGPIMAAWDGGRFAAPLHESLVVLGYDVAFVDCMAFVGAPNPDVLIDAIAETVKGICQNPALIAGHAFGGLAAVHMGPRFPNAAILGLSAPVRINKGLHRKLNALCDLLDVGNYTAAMDLLHDYVGAPRVSMTVSSDAARAMSRMFQNLIDLAALPLSPVRRQSLLVYGAHSDLVMIDHLPDEMLPFGRTVEGAGMRVLNDAPDATLNLVTDWISQQ